MKYTAQMPNNSTTRKTLEGENTLSIVLLVESGFR